jgi:phosphoglycolate phosphatase
MESLRSCLLEFLKSRSGGTPVTFQAVLFDLDGTLLDTLEDLAVSMNTALESFGFPPHPVEAYRYMVGDGMDTLARRAIPENRIEPATVMACVDRMKSQYRQHWLDTTKPYDGIPDLLDALAQRTIPMAILSNKPDDFTKPMVEKVLAKWSFTEVRGVSEDTPRKPNPSGALQIAERLGVDPAEFLYVGDTNTDMETARSAGMYPVGVLWGFRTEEELQMSGAENVIARPTDLLDLLDRSRN